MANALLAWDNAVLDGITALDKTADWGYAGGLYGNSTAGNLATPNINEQWQKAYTSTTPGQASLAFAVTGAPTLALIGLADHNLWVGAQVRLYGSNNANGTSPVYDTGVIDMYPAALTAAARAGLRLNWWHKLSSPTAAAYWFLEFQNTGAAATGTISAGKLLLMRSVWQPTVNMLDGAELSFLHGATVQEAMSGTRWFTERDAPRTARFQLGQMPETEMMRNALDLSRLAASANRDLLWVFDPADGEHLMRRSFFGRLAQAPSLSVINASQWRSQFVVEEYV